MTRRAVLVLAVALAIVGLFTGGLAWLLDTPRPKPGVSREERLYVTMCADCHGDDGRGTWRAALFFIDPGDLTDPARMREHTDRYLFDIIKHGGSPIGRPGMPGFAHVPDAEIEALVRYLRTISGTSRPGSG